uniref:Ribonuclease H-like domain-containing protein n=1 Tax=Tanacetum cinerariifolium TaxID=118510 RepID=A0A699GQV4_TANCI|nr:ribonuclease H-like domain-containing protein [Tanacetum cinerariifolium]
MTSSPVHDWYQSGEGYHAVPPPYKGIFMPPKLDLVFHDAPTTNETVSTVLNVKPSTTKPTKCQGKLDPSQLWLGSQKTLTLLFDVQGNPQHALKDKGVIDNGYSRHIIGNISYLSDFDEISGGYVAFGGNPKGGKITSKDTECIVLSSNFKLPDDNHVLLRVPRENNMYNVYLKNIVPSGDLTCLFEKATLDEVLLTKPHNKTPYELLLGRKPSIGFMRPFGYLVTILNTLDPLGKFDGKVDEGFLVGYSISSKAFRLFKSRTIIVQEKLHINFMENQPNVVGSGPTWLFDIDTLTHSMNYQPVVVRNQPNSSADPQNTNSDTTFEVKESESEVHVSSSSSTKTKKHDDKTKREAKGKSHVELSTRVRNLSEKFEDFSSNSTNGVNPASTPVTAVEPNSTNSTNTFSATSHSNNAISLNFELGGKSSFVNHSQYPDDPDMLALEDNVFPKNWIY